MTQYLDQPPEYYVGEFLETHWGSVPPPTSGLTPVWNKNDTLDTTEFPVTTNWNAGDTYPIISLTNRDGNVIGGGETNYSSKQGDGSGNNQNREETMLLTVHADSSQTYGADDVRAEVIAWLLVEHITSLVEEYGECPDAAEISSYYFEPPEGTIPSQDSTAPVHQEQGTFTVNWHRTP